MVGMRKSLAQLMQQFAQVRVCLGLVRIRPQEKGQMRASLGSSPVQHEIGEQGLQAGDIDCRHGSIARHQQEVTQQMDVQGRDQQESFCVVVSFKHVSGSRLSSMASSATVWSAPGLSALLTTKISAISRIPALMA